MKNYYYSSIVAAAIAVGALFSFAACGEADVAQHLMKYKRNYVVQITDPGKSKGSCTGWSLLTPHGVHLTITNAHCLGLMDSNRQLLALTEDGREVLVNVLYESPITDMAILSPIPGLPTLQLAESPVELGDKIFSLGHPLGQELRASSGYVSNPKKLVVIPLPNLPPELCILPKHTNITVFYFGIIPVTLCAEQVFAIDSSMVIYGGSSGSPLLDANGEFVIGLVFAGNTTSNYGLAIPLEDIKKSLELAGLY
jgi:S1-C subfamily serine protease